MTIGGRNARAISLNAIKLQLEMGPHKFTQSTIIIPRVILKRLKNSNAIHLYILGLNLEGCRRSTLKFRLWQATYSLHSNVTEAARSSSKRV